MADSGGSELNEDEFLCCSICFHEYDLQLMRPKVLPCSHTFCFTCLKALHSGNTLKCPVCRRNAVEITDVLTLPNNKYVQYIVHLSEKLRDAQAQIKRNNVIETSSKPAPKIFRVIDWGRLVSGCIECFSRIMLLQNPDIVYVTVFEGDLLHILMKAFPKFRFRTSKHSRLLVILINETVYDSCTHLDLTLSNNYHASSLQKDFILEVNAHCGPMKLKLLHVDLFGEFGEHSQKYLKAIFKDVRTTDPNANVILGLGGYVKNNQLMNAGGLPTRLKCMWEACGKPQKCKLEFNSDVAGLEIESLNEENFTAELTNSDHLILNHRSHRFFLSPSALGAFVEPKSFRFLSLHNHSLQNHSLVIVDLIVNRKDT